MRKFPVLRQKNGVSFPLTGVRRPGAGKGMLIHLTSIERQTDGIASEQRVTQEPMRNWSDILSALARETHSRFRPCLCDDLRDRNRGCLLETVGSSNGWSAARGDRRPN